jgi:hypothetical protein
MCWWHHLLKTKGWALVGGPGCYRLTPPGTEGTAGTGDVDTGDVTADLDTNLASGSRAPP